MLKPLASIVFMICGVTLYGAEAQKSSAEIWNEGVEAFRNRESQKALELLRPIVLDKDFGARAAELVASIEYDSSRDPNCTNALESLERAAIDAQTALRSAPDDERLRRNFERAISPLLELRETKRINEIEKAAQGQDPRTILRNVRNSARELMKESATYRTNSAPVRIACSDRLAATAKNLGDEVVKAKILLDSSDTAKSGGNEEDFVKYLTRLDGAGAFLKQGEKDLEDIASGACSSIATAENEFTLLYKVIMPPREALYEDYAAQSNAWQDIETVNNRDWQIEAYDFTKIFRSRLEELFIECDQMAQADTNATPLSAETKERISSLAAQVESLQEGLVKEALPPKQQEALNLIGEIIKLLPGSQQPSQQPKQQENNQQSKEQDNESPRNSEQNREQDDDKGEENSPRQQKSQELEEKEPEEKSAPKQQEKSDEEKKLESMLKLPEERTKELNDKKDEFFKNRILQDERDW